LYYFSVYLNPIKERYFYDWQKALTRLPPCSWNSIINFNNYDFFLKAFAKVYIFFQSANILEIIFQKKSFYIAL